MLTPKNARGRPVTKLCLALEAFRRTDEGRIRDAKAFLTHFFPQDKSGAKDRIFLHMPNEVRADLLSNWGIRGKKSALRDDDDRVRTTINDALNAGDIDAPVIEEGVTPDILTDWVPLEDWWSFWRGTALPLGSVRKALALARDLSLFDERWFFEHLALKSQKLIGIDVVCAALSKEQIVAWIQAVHQTGDASPTGLVAAVGWETILAKTAHEGLLFALDALARQIGLTETSPEDRKSDMPRQSSAPSEPPPTPRLDVPARISARPSHEDMGSPGIPGDGSGVSATPQPEAVIAKPAPLPTPPGAQSKAESLPPPPPQKSASLPPPRESTPVVSVTPLSPIPKADPTPKPAGAPTSTKPPIPISTKTPEPAVSRPPPVPTSAKQPPAVSKPPPVPAAAKQPAPVSKEPPKPPPSAPNQVAQAVSRPPGRPPSSIAPAVQDLPSVIIEDDPFFPPPPVVTPTASSVPNAPASMPPNARSLFLGAAAEPPPMRPPAATIVGVAPQALFGGADDVAMPTFSVPPADPEWAPTKAEPGDMGWDLVHGVTRPMGTHVQPRYNFDDDDEPTSEIDLPTDVGRRS